MSDLHLTAVDDVWLHVACRESISRELSDYFTFKPNNYQFIRRNPRYKKWDGALHLFKLRTQTMYRGLAPRLVEFAEQRGYTLTSAIPTPDPCYPGADLDDFLASLSLPFAVRDYQYAAIRAALDEHRHIILSPTGSGKSFIIYLIAQALQVKTLLIVPTIGLVTQMLADFKSYGADLSRIHTIHAGQQKNADADLYISTWQSIYELPESYYQQFDCVMVDEVHQAKAKSLTGILEKCPRVPYRFGFTGTLDDTQAHQLILEGLFGSVTKVTSTSALVKDQQLAPMQVHLVALEYPPAVRGHYKRASYTDEIDYIVGEPARTELLAKMVSKLTGNVLVLFTLIDKHGKTLVERIRHHAPHKAVHFVTGAVAADEREHVRNTVEDDETTEQVIVASYGVFSTGVNIRRLHHLVFASAGKSKIRTLQSIGRGLRTHASKTRIVIWDFADDLRVGAWENYAWRHAAERVELYSKERFPVTLYKLPVSRATIPVPVVPTLELSDENS